MQTTWFFLFWIFKVAVESACRWKYSPGNYWNVAYEKKLIWIFGILNLMQMWETIGDEKFMVFH